MSTKDDAIEAMQTAIDIYKASRDKLEQVIAQKEFDGEEIKKETNEIATLSRKIGHFQDVLNEGKAAFTFVSAPNREEIEEVARHIRKIRDLAVQDAALSAGFKIITDALASANDLQGKVENG